MKHTIKRFLYAVAPKAATTLFSARARAHSQRLVRAWGCNVIDAQLIKRFGSVVQDGPFKGLTLSRAAQAEQLGPFLLGLYESELDGVWDEVLAGTYAQIIDVGSKFGYYAVGLARQFPDAVTVAFDTDPWARKATRELANANGTHNVAVRGFCDVAWLRSHVQPGAFIISDCEGYEHTLFASETIPALGSCTLLIEVHEDQSPGVSSALRARLGGTHSIHAVDTSAPRRSPSVDLSFLSQSEYQLATHEVRGPQTWLFCRPI